jgi:hypothetical protein
MFARIDRRLFLRGLALAGGLTLAPLATLAQDVPSQIRSTTDVRPRIPDEHDRPYQRETQSHRGWEIREPQYTVFATTSQADVRWAAAQVAAAWNNASRLASRWTRVHENPDFGLNSLQVVIDDEPLRDRDGPLTTVNVVGIQSQVQINVAPGQPPLKQQLVRLREGTALAMLHTAGLDSAAPPWVVAGIAGFAGREGLSDEQVAQAAAQGDFAHLGGQQWRFLRETQDVLAYNKVNQSAAAEQVKFLLTGNDAQHAPALLAALGNANTDAARTAAAGGAFTNFPGDAQPARTATAFDNLIASRQGQFEAWQKEPLAGQPVFEPAANAAPELVAAEAEMLVLLKLHQRLTSPTPAATAVAVNSGAPRTKIITFDKTKGATTAPAKQGTQIASFGELAARLTDPSQPVWATLDVDGSLLLSTDVQRVSELLATAEHRYALESTGGNATLVRQLPGNRTLRGSLAENAKQKSRPLAKFEVAGMTRPKREANAPAQPPRQARR